MSAYKPPEHPFRPVLFEGDYPKPDESAEAIRRQLEERWDDDLEERHRNAAFEEARSERQELLQSRTSGPLGQGPYSYRRQDGPLSPREQQQQIEYEEASRRLRLGLPDSSEEMPPVAVAGGLPVRFND